MADCFFHGYSGGPGGRCSGCAREDRDGLTRGTDPGYPSENTAAVLAGPQFHPAALVRTPRRRSR